MKSKMEKDAEVETVVVFVALCLGWIVALGVLIWLG
jgi:hypothetical protein